MKLTIISDEHDVDIYTAWQIIGQILAKPQSSIGLATGQTTIGIHETIVDIYTKYKFDSSKVRIFAADEIINVPPFSDVTCAKRLLEQFITPLNIPESNFIMPPTLSDDFDKESKIYEMRIIENDGIDLQILGLGLDGHIAMNLPGTPFGSLTRSVTLSGELEERVGRQIKLPSGQKLGGITLGITTIMNAKKIVLVAKGKKKAMIIKQTLLNPITTEIPASVLRLHPNCEFILDKDAASEYISTKAAL